MRFIGNILIWAFIATGLIAATSFYVWPVGADPAADSRFEIGTSDDGSTRYAQLLRAVQTADGNQIAAADTELDPPTLAFIREAGINRVIVKHSSAIGTTFANWTGKWLFLGSAAGLVFGALLLRSAAKREVEAGDDLDTLRTSPEEITGQIRAAIADLRAALPAIEGRNAKQHAIVASLGEVQAELVPAFVDTRPVLIAKRGMGGFATVMDKFAAMERQINRAWSAAADDALEESTEALDNAAVLADDFAKAIGIG